MNVDELEGIFTALLKKDVRIRILMINPHNGPLLYARFAVRRDTHTLAAARDALRRQIHLLLSRIADQGRFFAETWNCGCPT